jgi:hypothetical protein
VRMSFLVYGLLYLVIEMIGHQLESVAWREISPLLIATAVTDAMLVVSVLAAVLVAGDLTKHRWRPVLHGWMHRHDAAHGDWWESDDEHEYAEVVDVTSWRAEPLALPAAPSSGPAATARHEGPTYATAGTAAGSARPFPEDDGRLL